MSLISRQQIATSEGATVLLGVFVAYQVAVVVYRVFFHPLSKFPGPKLYAATDFPYALRNYLLGTWVRSVRDLHDNFGAIVRIGPNRLAVDASIGWADIYASKTDGRPEFQKWNEFFSAANSEDAHILISDKENHRRQRRVLGYAFTNTALQAQEPLIKQCVDLFMLRLKEYAKMNEPVDVVQWYQYTTFDTIGTLTFGESFDCLESSTNRPWAHMIISGFKLACQSHFVRQYPILRPFGTFFTGKEAVKQREQHYALTVQKMKKRIQMQNPRKDFMTYILDHIGQKNGMTEKEMLGNTETFVQAGSETTASALSGLTYYLAKDFERQKRLADEIRSTFDSEDGITMKSTAGLPYLQACIDEGLRIYPPAAETPSRISPGGIVGGEYIPPGTIVTIYQWACHHSTRHFKEPGTFAPERWLPLSHHYYDASMASDRRDIVKPFSFGPRDCIGKNLAYAEMRVMIARLIWNFDIELADPSEDWVGKQDIFVVYIKSPLMVRLKSVA